MNIFSHPKGLYLLSFTELWERFGFYSLQTIIVLYMSHALHFDDTKAYLIYGSFSSLLYLTPVLGGMLADRYFGFQRCIILGGVSFFIGYMLCALGSFTLLLLGLSFVIIGNGLLKPNISSMVGLLYKRGDSRRDAGFTLFYMGINIGSLIPPVFIGVLVKYYGWYSGFLVSAAGIFIGILLFLLLRKRPGGKGGVSSTRPLYHARRIFNKVNLLFFVAVIVLVAILFFLLHYETFTNIVLLSCSVLYCIWVIFCAMKYPPSERKNILAMTLLIIVSIGFWTLYNQTFTSLMLFADRNMTMHFFGFPINAEFTQFFNPFFIILLGPVLSVLWVKLGSRNINPSVPFKFFLATIFMLLGFVVLALACKYTANDQGMVSSGWLAFNYFLQTIGELLISPVGLSMITMLTPEGLTGTMMGMWFLSTAAAFSLSGFLATFSSVSKTNTVIQSLTSYEDTFIMYALIALILCVITGLLVRPIQRLISMHQN